MAKISRPFSFVFALSLQVACGGHAPARDAGATGDAVAHSEAEPDRDAGEHAQDGESEAEQEASASDAALSHEPAARDANTPGDAALAGGSAAPIQIVAPGRSRISVWSRKICALDEQRDVVCWGADGSSAPTSGVALHGPFRSVKRCSGSAFTPVCAIADDATLTCAGWLGGASGRVQDPQDCRPPIKVAAISCGSFGDSDIAVLDPEGGIARVTELCDLYPEGRDAGPYDRVEMVDSNVCALDRQQKVHCFAGQLLPDGGSAPEDPVIDDAYIDLAVGETATCGVTREGRVRCWDYRGVEAAGKDSFATTASNRGVKVARLATDPEGGDVLCALFEDGSVGCSYAFERGAIRMVQKDKPWSEIAVDHETLCGVRSDRSVDCRSAYPNCSSADCAKLAQAIAPPDGLRVPE